jgi:hypothetical protein
MNVLFRLMSYDSSNKFAEKDLLILRFGGKSLTSIAECTFFNFGSYSNLNSIMKVIIIIKIIPALQTHQKIFILSISLATFRRTYFQPLKFHLIIDLPISVVFYMQVCRTFNILHPLGYPFRVHCVSQSIPASTKLRSNADHQSPSPICPGRLPTTRSWNKPFSLNASHQMFGHSPSS